MDALAPWVRAALDVGRAAGVACLAEAIPFCLLPGYERHVAELHIPPTEIVYDGFVVPDYRRDRMDRGKTRFAGCARCRFEPMCEGPWREYPEQLGGDEFRAVEGPRVIDAAIVLDDRFALLGAPAPRCERRGELTQPWIAIAFFPEAGSTACTIEARNLQAGVQTLADAGVAVIGVSPDAPARQAAMARELALSFPLESDADLELARAYGVLADGRFRRSTYLIGPQRRIDHVIVAPDPPRHVEQIVDAVRRFEASPRPLERGEELVVLRKAPQPAHEVAAALSLSDDHEEFSD
jgi:peroxiredoxin Q/BCP